MIQNNSIYQGRIQDIKLKRGGALKNIARSGAMRTFSEEMLCEKSRFYAKKLFFPILRGVRNLGDISCDKSRFDGNKNDIFSNIS